MLLKIFKFGSETAVLRSGACKRLAAVIACVSVLAGCESLPEMPSLPDFPSFSDIRTGLSETFMWPDESAIKEAVPAQGAVKEKEETTSASGSAEPMLLNSPF